MPTKIATYSLPKVTPSQAKYVCFLDKAKDDEVFFTREMASLCGGGTQVHRFDTEMRDKYSIDIPNRDGGGKQKVWGHPNAIKKLRQLYGN